MRRKLFLGSVLAICTATFITILIAAPLITRQMENQLKSQLETVLALMDSSSGEFISDPQNACMQIHDSLEGIGEPIRITVISPDGDVLGDSESISAITENHLSRPEIMSAVETGKGFDIRRSQTFGERYYYAAVMQDSYIFRAALPMREVDSVRLSLFLSLMISLLVGLGFSLLVSVKTNKSLIEPIEGILQAMDDAVMQVDSRGKIILLNERAGELLFSPGLSAGDMLDGSQILEKLRQILKKAEGSEETLNTIMKLSSPEERILSISARPVKSGSSVILSTFSDITHVCRLENLRSQFVANVTHELKTPLTSIRGFIELLKSGDRDENTRKYFYDVLEIEAERLQNLINDMLSLSEIESSDEDSSARMCNLKSIIKKTADSLNPQAKKRGVSVSVKGDSKIEIIAGESRIRQLFGNLIDNAIKYNKEGGAVTVEIKKEEDFAAVSVSDTGIGIPEKHMERIFERFYRVDKSRSREIGGTGLGLSIVKHLVHLYNGEIILSSVEGEGCVFTVKIPLPNDSHDQND